MRPTPRSRPAPMSAVAFVHRGHHSHPLLDRVRSRVRGDADSDGRLKWRLLDALLLIVALTVSYEFVLLLDPPSRATTGGGDVTVVQAEKWMAAELPSGARVGVDSAVFTDLAGTGRFAVRMLAIGSTDWHTDTHILSTPQLRDEATHDPALSVALHSSLPIAVFGVSLRRVEVRQVALDGAAALTSRWRQDVVDRAVAGTGLLRNPRVQASSSSLGVLQHGQLDLRAVVLVALLAAKADVRIMDITADPSEAAARMPARRMVIAITDAGPSLAAALAMLPAAYRPSSITVLPGGPRAMEWPVAVAPVKSLG